MKRKIAKIISVIVTLIMVCSLIPGTLFSGIAVGTDEITVGVMSDTHYYPRTLMGSDINEFIDACKLNSSTSYLTPALIDAALAEFEAQAATNNMKYLFIPGDMARNGEYESHTAIAKVLKDFENRTGIQVLVINGNHDIRKANATRFLNGKYVPTKWCEPEDFRDIYADLGYDLADSFFTPSAGNEAGQLSYAATLDGGYRFIALDCACYSSDMHSKGLNEAETRGAFSDDLLEWTLNEIKKAKEDGLEVIGMTHFNIVEHYDHEDNTMQAFVIDNWQEVCEKLADAGMHFAFTGHLHFHDVAQWTSDNGETMTDCSTASVQVFPNYTRTVTFSKGTDGSTTMQYSTNEIDNTKQIEAFGTTYPKPYKYTAYALNYGGGDLSDFGTRYVEYFLTQSIGPEIQEAGLYNYLDNLLDIDSVISNLLKNTDLGSADGITKTAIKAVLKSVCAQLQKKYIDNPENALNLVRKVLDKLCAVEVSSKPCTKYIDTLGFGNPNKNGNFGDAVASVLAYMYYGDENRSDDPFINDVLDRFYRGENAQEIFDTLYDIVMNDILKDELLPTIQIDPVGILGAINDDTKNDILNTVLGTLLGVAEPVNDSIPKLDAGNIVSVIFALGVTDYGSLEELVNSYIDEYITDSEMETIAYEFYNFIYDFTTDKLPTDLENTITYSGKVPVTPTVEDLRLPSGISVTFGDDAATSRNISWFTKVGVTGTDIEIIPAGSNKNFTGTPSTKGVSAQTQRTTRQYPGIDLGIFGILKYTFNINRHIIKLTGLQPGQKYYYRIGDAARNWWSNIGVIDTADNTNEFTFFHFTDSQGGIERQYRKWADTVNTAYSMYPDAAFIMHSGDQVDKGTNFKQWNWLFNTASDNLMKTVMMPTAGNHENSESSVTEYNILSNVPEQNLETGVYYSYDYNNAHFTVLNSNDLNKDGTLSEKQLNWLRNDVQSSNADWKIVSLHKAIYSNGNHFDDDDIKGLRNQLTSLMPELGIDLVLQGHDHVYLRTNVIKDNAVVETQTANIFNNNVPYTAKVKPAGTIYAIDGRSGVKYYQPKDSSETDALFPRAEVIYDAVSPMFSAIQIKGDKLFFDSYTVDNGTATKVDSFAIAKSLTAKEAAENNIQDGTIIKDEPTSSGGASGSSTVDKFRSPKTAGIYLDPVIFVIPAAAGLIICAIVFIRKKRNEY